MISPLSLQITQQSPNPNRTKHKQKKKKIESITDETKRQTIGWKTIRINGTGTEIVISLPETERLGSPWRNSNGASAFPLFHFFSVRPWRNDSNSERNKWERQLATTTQTSIYIYNITSDSRRRRSPRSHFSRI